jgi:hypothetical protein
MSEESSEHDAEVMEAVRERKEAIAGFEEMRERAEMRALSRHSLVKPLTEKEVKRFKKLGKKYLK